MQPLFFEETDMKKTSILKAFFLLLPSSNIIAGTFIEKSIDDFIHEQLTSTGAEKMALGSGEREIAPNVKSYRIRQGGYFAWPLLSKDVQQKFMSWCSDNSGEVIQTLKNDDKIALANFITYSAGRWVNKNNYVVVACKTTSTSYTMLIEERTTYITNDIERFFYVLDGDSTTTTAINQGKAWIEKAKANSKLREQCVVKQRTNAISHLAVGNRLLDNSLIVDKKNSLLQIQDSNDQTKWIPVSELKDYQLFSVKNCD